jgi:large repetitive protein
MKRSLPLALVAIVLTTLVGCNLSQTAKAVSLGEQAGSVIAGKTGSVTFGATTTNIADGAAGSLAWYTASDGATIASAPQGVTASVSAVASNAATVTMATDATAIVGSYYFKLTEDTAESALATLKLSPVPVSGVALNLTTLNLIAGGSSATLTATVSPSDASDKAIAWTSSKASVATVDGSGVVKPIAAGTAIITATSADGGKAGTCSVNVQGATGVTVTNPASLATVSFTLSSSTLSYGSDLSATAKASVTPDSVAWYFDGVAVPGQTTLSFSGGSGLAYGPHALMVIVILRDVYASATQYFAVQ